MALLFAIKSLNKAIEKFRSDSGGDVKTLAENVDPETAKKRYLALVDLIYSPFNKYPKDTAERREILKKKLVKEITGRLVDAELFDVIKSDVRHAFFYGLTDKNTLSASRILLKAAMYCLPLGEVMDPLFKKVSEDDDPPREYYLLFMDFLDRVVDEFECLASDSSSEDHFFYDESAFKARIRELDARWSNLPEIYKIRPYHWDLIKSMVSKALTKGVNYEIGGGYAFHFLMSCFSAHTAFSLFNLSEMKEWIEKALKPEKMKFFIHYLLVLKFLRVAPSCYGFEELLPSEDEWPDRKLLPNNMKFASEDMRKKTRLIRRILISEPFLKSLQTIVQRLGNEQTSSEMRITCNSLIAHYLILFPGSLIRDLDAHKKEVKKAIKYWIKYDLSDPAMDSRQFLLYCMIYRDINDYYDLLKQLNNTLENNKKIKISSLEDGLYSFYYLIFNGNLKEHDPVYDQISKELQTIAHYLMKNGLSDKHNARTSLRLLKMLYAPHLHYDLRQYVSALLPKDVRREDMEALFSRISASIFSKDVVKKSVELIKNNISAPDAPTENYEYLRDISSILPNTSILEVCSNEQEVIEKIIVNGLSSQKNACIPFAFLQDLLDYVSSKKNPPQTLVSTLLESLSHNLSKPDAQKENYALLSIVQRSFVKNNKTWSDYPDLLKNVLLEGLTSKATASYALDFLSVVKSENAEIVCSPELISNLIKRIDVTDLHPYLYLWHLLKEEKLVLTEIDAQELQKKVVGIGKRKGLISQEVFSANMRLFGRGKKYYGVYQGDILKDLFNYCVDRVSSGLDREEAKDGFPCANYQSKVKGEKRNI